VEVSEDLNPPRPQGLVNLDLTIPPGEGHFPYEGRVSAGARVLRCDCLDDSTAEVRTSRLGIAARFCEPLKLEF
jgi:hypothetical protein